jgi:cysteine-rich repeat protein
VRHLTLFALVCLTASAATAQPAPGFLLATESAGGSIVNIAGGGDVSLAPRFATGLATPTGICLGPGGEVYVAEGGGDLLVATTGGDLSGDAPFATGLGNAIGLSCSDTQILVADNAGGKIIDATAGGDLSAAAPFAEGLPLVTHLLRASDATLYAQAGTNIFDVSAGGDFSGATPFASGLQGGGLTERGTQLLAGSSNEVVDFTGGGDLSGADPFASGVSVAALLDVPGLGLFAATGNGSGVFEISAGGDFSSADPFASGVATTFGLAGLLHIAGCGDGIEQGEEACDDGNTSDGDGCSAFCENEPLCGAAPSTGCIAVGKARLKIDERKTGKEKLALSLSKLDGAVSAAEFGDPVTGETRFGVCLYDAADALAGELQVARAGETCGKQPCWKAKGEAAFAYKDPSALDGGVVKINAKGGDGNGKLSLSARNKAAKGQTSLPALAAGLAGAASATVQVVTSDASCFEASLGNVKKAEAAQFLGSAP